jgi:hypothetical protein
MNFINELNMKTKNYLIILIVLVLIISACNKNDNKESSDDLKKKELELKEKELQLKEKEMLDKKEAELKEKEKQIERNNGTEQNFNSDNQNGSVPGKYPEASLRQLYSEDLYRLSKYELKIMRNEIYARYGYIFQTDDMRDYFNRQSWYVPKYTDVNPFISRIEKKNIELIKYFEK